MIIPRNNKFILISVGFILLTIITTYPLIFNMNTYIPAFESTDEPFAALWNFWWLKYITVNKLPSLLASQIAFPFGQDLRGGYPLWNFINKWLSVFTNNIFAYNLEALLSFVLSAIFMYLLAIFVTKDKKAAFLSAVIYAFCPYHFVRSWQHLGLAQIQWLPLYLLSLLKLRERPDIRHALLAGLALYLIASFDYYYFFFMFIISVAYLIFLFLNSLRLSFKTKGYVKKDFKVIRMLFLSGAVTFVLTLPVTFPMLRTRITKPLGMPSVYNSFFRPFEDLFAQSAKPLSYLLPATTHPIFGNFTEKFLGTSLYGESLTEHTLYLGWIPLWLSYIAFSKWIKSKKTLPAINKDENNRCFYTKLFVFWVAVAWLFSQPPWWNIFGMKVYLPSFFMYKIAPMFRAYCRFGVVVMLGVAVLAGLGLKIILERFKTQKTKIAVTAIFCGLVLFEFWNWPPFKVIDVSGVPAVYYWLKGQPADTVIAEYPLDTQGANELYKFYQTKHGKKIINGSLPGTYANKVAKVMTKISESSSAGMLKWMGVRYVLVHAQGYLKSELVEDREELNKIPKNPGLKFIKTFPPQGCPQKDIMCVQKSQAIDVYEVIAFPQQPK